MTGADLLGQPSFLCGEWGWNRGNLASRGASVEPQAELAHARMGVLVELLSGARRADCVYPTHNDNSGAHMGVRMK
jgi:hypothetical protein